MSRNTRQAILVALELELWRETSRHADLASFLPRLATLLHDVSPVRRLAIVWVDVLAGGIENLAEVVVEATGAQFRVTRSLHPIESAELSGLLAWCRSRGVTALAQALHDGLPEPTAARFSGATVGPLRAGDGEPIGLVALEPQGAERVEDVAEVVTLLLEPVATALENDRQARDAAALREAAEADRTSLLNRLGRENVTETVVGADGGLRDVMSRVALVSRSDVPVLLIGETGSGKEVVARAIHTGSPRVRRPFLRVNCGAIPPELIDSELFGHERGSFTGATSLRKGWFERADGGTLFLDEVGELPHAAQVRLLRIVQDGTFERVGGQQQLAVDVRIIAATHRDLPAMVAAGTFREDLWYRIAVFPIHLPPLRERPEDIPALARHFALKAARRFGTPPRIPTPDDIRLLLTYAWPGNVRELAAVLDRATILGDGKSLDLRPALGQQPASAAAPVTLPRANGQLAPDESASTFKTLDAAMGDHIRAALTRVGGRIEGPQGAARLLGINPHTLRARMRKLRLDWSEYRAGVK
jgi:hydrogenase-4 transcriptional activator